MPIVRFVFRRSVLPASAAAVLLAGAFTALGTGAASPAWAVPLGPVRAYMELPASAVGESAGLRLTEELSAFSLSTTQQGGAPTGSAGGRAITTTISQVSATLPIDTTSTALLQDVITGKLINPVEVVMYHLALGGKEPFLSYRFTNARISSYQLEDDAAGALVQVSFTYTAIQVKYSASNPKGSGAPVPTGWNLVTSKLT